MSPGPSAGVLGAAALAYGCVGGVMCTLVTLVLVVLLSRRHRSRDEHLQRWTAQYGWIVTESPTVDWGARLPGTNRDGVARTFCGTFGGRPVCVGDYSYTYTAIVDGQQSTAGETYVVVVVRLPEPCPAVAVEPRGVFSKLGRVLTGDHSAGIGEPEFDRKFRIVADDPLTARRLLGPALVAAHVAGQVPAWSIQHTELMTYYPGRIREPEQLPAYAAPLVWVADRLGR